MAVLIGVDVIDKVGGEGGAPFELGMGNADAGVDDEDGDALAGGGVEDVGGGTPAGGGVAEAGQAGGGRILRGEGVELDVLVRLDVLDLLGGVDLVDHIIVGIESHGTPCTQLERLDTGGQDSAGLCVALA